MVTTAWSEYPVFIPQGEEHLAAVITLPERRARGLVLLMTGGGGSPRSHRASLFTRVARRLAERELASIRIDPRGVGDSTGVAFFSLTAPPVEQTLEVARFAMRATGIESLGIAGNCAGARTALDLSPHLPQLRTAALIFVKPMAVARSTNPAVLKTKAIVGRLPGIGEASKKMYWWTKRGRARPVVDKLRSMVVNLDLLLLEADTEKAGRLLRDGYGLQGGEGKRFEIRALPGGSERAFRSPERQRYALETLVEWFDETFPA